MVSEAKVAGSLRYRTRGRLFADMALMTVLAFLLLAPLEYYAVYEFGDYRGLFSPE